MHKTSPNDSVSCCSWRCLHVLVAVVSNYPFKEKESLLSKKKEREKRHPIFELRVEKYSATTGLSRYI